MTNQPLPEFIAETRTITVKRRGQPDYVFTVRGLNLLDLTELFKTHLPDIGAVVTMYQDSGAQLNDATLGKLAMRIWKDAPGLLAHVIARAANNPDWVESAVRLPMMTQIEALREIAAMTFDEVGGAKKLLADIAELDKAGLLDPTKMSA